MKACVLKENKVVECEEIAMVQNFENHVLIKVKACGICSSDFNRVYRNGAYFYPIVLGHEFSGEIVECGNRVNNDLLGKKAAVFPLLPCFECEFCLQKMYAQCKNYNYFGSRKYGAMAEYVTVPVWNIKVIPDDMDCTVAALAEPCAVAVHTVDKIDNLNNKTVCVSGSGTIGILIGLIAKIGGAEVSFILRNDKKLDFLKSLGFKNFVYEGTESKSFDTLIECVGANSSLENCVKYVKSKGQIILVGNPNGDMTLEKKLYWKILRSELNVCGVWNSSYKNSETDDWDKAIDFLYKNSSIVSKLITNKFKLEDGIKAFDEMVNSDKLCIKGVFINE